MVELARSGPARRRGVGKVRRMPYRPDGGDLDLDASIDALAIARAGGAPPDPDELRVRGWVKPGTALCLLVDRSGSMSGRPLATAAVAASAVAFRAPADHSVLAFSSDVIVAKSQETPRAAEQIVNDLLVLRGHGTTDLALALRAAHAAARPVPRRPAHRRPAVGLPGDGAGRRDRGGGPLRRAVGRGARGRQRRGRGAGRRRSAPGW